jgi:hypothetical protein
MTPTIKFILGMVLVYFTYYIGGGTILERGFGSAIVFIVSVIVATLFLNIEFDKK